MNEMTQAQAHQVWLQAVELVKDRVLAPSLYIALEAGHGITVDGDEFILGFSNSDSPLAGHIRGAQHGAVVEQAVSALLKKKVRIRVIEGTTTQDYENYKALKARSEATLTNLSQQREHNRRIELQWEEVMETVTRGYARLQYRQFAQVRASYINHAFKLINDAIEKVGYTDESEDVHKRALNRLFEKLATAVDIPSTFLAYEFFRLRDEGKLS